MGGSAVGCEVPCSVPRQREARTSAHAQQGIELRPRPAGFDLAPHLPEVRRGPTRLTKPRNFHPQIHAVGGRVRVAQGPATLQME